MITTTLELTEYEAVEQTIAKIKTFKTDHGIKALKSAVTHGAFNMHPGYGDLTYVFKDKEYDHDELNIPVWIHDLYVDIEEEIFY